jgi:diacylglycerol kinase (ATP)
MALIHFIVNPLRPSIGLQWPYEEKKIERLTKDFKVHITRGRLHAEILSRKAAEEGAKLVVAVGGDSTLSEIVNGLYRASQGGHPAPALTFYPELKQGDFVRSIKLRSSFTEFLEAFLSNQAIEEKFDLGEVEYTGDYGQKVRRLFVNCAGFGFSSVLVGRLSVNYKVKRNKWSYLRLMARLLPFYRHPEVDIFVDDKKICSQQEILSVLIHNGKTAAHGLELSPHSDIHDGKLEITIIKKALPYRYLLGLLPVFAGHIRSLSFVQAQSCKRVKALSIHKTKKVRLDWDGDIWGYLPAEFRVLEKGLSIIR